MNVQKDVDTVDLKRDVPAILITLRYAVDREAFASLEGPAQAVVDFVGAVGNELQRGVRE